jgi:hypothetical protein
MKTLLSICIALLGLVGCRSDDVLPADPSKLMGTWQLTAPLFAQYTPTISIEPIISNGNIIPPPVYLIRGSGLLNTYGSSLNYAPRGSTTQPGEITVELPVRWSKVGETDEIRQATDAYFQRLDRVNRYELRRNGNELRLLEDFDYSNALIFKRV